MEVKTHAIVTIFWNMPPHMSFTFMLLDFPELFVKKRLLFYSVGAITVCLKYTVNLTSFKRTSRLLK